MVRDNKQMNDDIQLFFDKHKTEIPDNGFLRRVKAALPTYTDRSWIVWLFAASGLVTSLALSYKTGLLNRIFSIAIEVPYYYWLAAIFALPLLVATYFLATNKYFLKI